MISASDVLHIFSEIHQYSMLLIELKDAMTLGISHSKEGKLTCFAVDEPLGAAERGKFVKQIYSGQAPASLRPLPMEQFLSSIEGKKAKHIWLETASDERKELGFLSIAELKTHFRSNSKRQHTGT